MSDPKVEPTKKPKSKSSRSKQASSSNAPKLKVVIRRLPPNLPETIFWQSVGQWVTEETVPWKLYVKGKLRSKPNKENIPSRAYVEFLTPEAVVAFNRDYNGHVFRDKQGNESAAVVEYAPFQKVPHPTRKMDSKVGTIETDEDFISFINALNKPAEPTPDVMNLATHAVAATEPTSTPLLDALKAAKESSTIKGYHSHYRDQANPPRTRAQQLDDEQTYNRKAPLLPKSQTDQDYTPNLVEPVVKDAGKGKEKEREGGGGGGGGKKKNKQKATTAAGPTSPGPSTQSKPTPPHMTKQTPQLQAPPSPSATRASAAEPPRPRPVVGIGARGGILAALGAATDARTTGASRKTSGRHREVSGGTSKTETPSVAQPPTTPLPAGVLAIPSSSIAPAASGGSATPSAPGKNRRGGKNRGRGAGGGSGEASINSSHTEMPRIDDPGQDLPPSAPAQRGRGGSGRSRGGRGRGRGRGGATGGGAGDQPSAPTG